MEIKENITAVLAGLLELTPEQESIISDYLCTNNMTGLLNNYKTLDLDEEVKQKLEALKVLADVLDEVKNG